MDQELRKIAVVHQINTLPWGIKGGNGWIWFKQEDDKRFKIQISISGNYDEYKKIKADVENFFTSKNCSLFIEKDMGSTFGYTRDLVFIDSEELKKIREEQDNRAPKALTYNIAQLNANGGIVTFGDVTNSNQSIDNSIKNIENEIEKKGGNDKEELYETLNEAKQIIDEISKTKVIKPKDSFIKRLGNHLSKHGWFYGAIVTLIGTAIIVILGSSK